MLIGPLVAPIRVPKKLRRPTRRYIANSGNGNHDAQEQRKPTFDHTKKREARWRIARDKRIRKGRGNRAIDAHRAVADKIGEALERATRRDLLERIDRALNARAYPTAISALLALET